MENPEKFQNNKKENLENPLVDAYLLIHNKKPEGLDDWQIAQDIVEVLGDPGWISDDLAKECVYRIVHSITYPDEEVKKKIILMAEEKAKDVFPELSGIDEIHMDQIEYAYNKWKEAER